MDKPMDRLTYRHILFDSNWPYLTLTDHNWPLLTFFGEVTEKKPLIGTDKKIYIVYSCNITSHPEHGKHLKSGIVDYSSRRLWFANAPSISMKDRVCPLTYWSVHSSICPSVCRSIHLSVHPSLVKINENQCTQVTRVSLAYLAFFKFIYCFNIVFIVFFSYY